MEEDLLIQIFCGLSLLSSGLVASVKSPFCLIGEQCTDLSGFSRGRGCMSLYLGVFIFSVAGGIGGVQILRFHRAALLSELQDPDGQTEHFNTRTGDGGDTGETRGSQWGS